MAIIPNPPINAISNEVKTPKVMTNITHLTDASKSLSITNIQSFGQCVVAFAPMNAHPLLSLDQWSVQIYLIANYLIDPSNLSHQFLANQIYLDTNQPRLEHLPPLGNCFVIKTKKIILSSERNYPNIFKQPKKNFKRQHFLSRRGRASNQQALI